MQSMNTCQKTDCQYYRHRTRRRIPSALAQAWKHVANKRGVVMATRDLTVGKAIGEDALAAVGAKERASLVLSRWFGYRGIVFSSPLAWIGSDLIVIPVYYMTMKRLRRKGEGDWSTS